MSQIKLGNEVFGVRYWAQWWPGRVPRFEVFKYFGFAPDTGSYYFQHKKFPSVFINKNFHQLAADSSFKPLLIDTSKLNIEYLVPSGPKVS